MNIHLENVNLQSTSGPNHFASKLMKYMHASFDYNKESDARLCFIETHKPKVENVPLIQRLDGIYFNLEQPYRLQNANIEKTYKEADGVIFQSDFNKKLTTEYFGEHKNGIVIHNGADVEYINSAPTLKNPAIDKYENVWSCASSWRPHKRLAENIRYFLNHSSEKECLIIAGEDAVGIPQHERIFYVGKVSVLQLIALYKRSKYFLHLAWLDHCPNVVVDARASGCQIICSSAGGTKEIAGPDAIVVKEDQWDFQPVKLYEPPMMDFDKKIKNDYDSEYNMREVAKKYENFLTSTKRKLDN
jgi:glycosyltransferase involved in cell wall biosynthesis